jgi:hypothetical protein
MHGMEQGQLSTGYVATAKDFNGRANPSVGPCAECRFWKPSDDPYGKPDARPGEWNQCHLVDRENANARAATDSTGAWEDAIPILMTRADFGCVQFEQRAENIDAPTK